MVTRASLLLLGASGCNAILGVDYFPPIEPGDAAIAVDTPDALDCGATTWETDFSIDPTTLDGNGDGFPDWRMRNGSAFPIADLEGGVWRSPSTSQPLDTNPVQRFLTRTRITARLRATSGTSATFGGVVWINFAWDDAMQTYSAVLVDVTLLSSNVQRVRLYAKTSANTFLVLAETMTGTDFVRAELDVDPANREVHFMLPELSAEMTTVVDTSAPIGAFDGYVTTFGYEASAEIDHLRVTVCGR